MWALLRIKCVGVAVRVCVCLSVCVWNKWKANNKLVHKYFGQTNNRSKMIPPQRFTPSKDLAQFQAETIYYVPHICTLCGSKWSAKGGRWREEEVCMCGRYPSGSTIVAVATAQKLQLYTHLPVLNCLTSNTKWPFSFIFMILPIPHMCGASSHPILSTLCRP